MEASCKTNGQDNDGILQWLMILHSHLSLRSVAPRMSNKVNRASSSSLFAAHANSSLSMSNTRRHESRSASSSYEKPASVFSCPVFSGRVKAWRAFPPYVTTSRSALRRSNSSLIASTCAKDQRVGPCGATYQEPSPSTEWCDDKFRRSGDNAAADDGC